MFRGESSMGLRLSASKPIWAMTGCRRVAYKLSRLTRCAASCSNRAYASGLQGKTQEALARVVLTILKSSTRSLNAEQTRKSPLEAG